jgi:hypothetical protein
MTPVYTIAGIKYVDISDFVQMISRLTITWDALITNTDNPFYDFTFVDQTISTIINNHIGRTDCVVITGLNSNQRHAFYKGLTLDIPYSKNRINNDVCNINIHLTSTYSPLWTIPSFSEYNLTYCISDILDDPFAPENFRTFYHDINIPNEHITTTSTNRIPVNLSQYIRFKRISRWYECKRRISQITASRTPLLTPENVIQGASALYNNRSRTTHSNKNRTVRLELSDMVFDIKDKITDSDFKSIMDKLQELIV